jgi:hypothetical protein
LAHYARGRRPPIKLVITLGHPLPSGGELPVGVGYFTKPYQPEKITRSIKGERESANWVRNIQWSRSGSATLNSTPSRASCTMAESLRSGPL